MSKKRIVSGSLCMIFVVFWAGCLDVEEEGEGNEPACICSAEVGCPEEVCDIQFELPAACGETYSQGQLAIGQGEPISFQPAGMFSSCEQTIGVGERVELSLVLGEEEATFSGITAECEAGGERAVPLFCTLKFELGESCRDVHDSAVIVIEGEDVGEAQMDKPFSPCLLLIQEQELVTAMRAGTDLVVGQTFTCNQQGELRHILECP